MRNIFIGAALLALAACQSTANLNEGQRLAWSCANDNAFSLRTVGDSVEVYAGGETHRLIRGAEDGAYTNGTVTLTQSGGRATLTGANGGPYENCRRQRSDWWPDLW